MACGEEQSWPERLDTPGRKRVLALDGGGVRGALTIGVLTEMEARLRERHGRPDLVLADVFDLIGGTSTGAIIAGGLALGMSCRQLEDLYRRLGPRVFGRSFRTPFVQARFDPDRLHAVLRSELGDATLGTAPWKTGFAAVAKRVDTASPWVITNCPRARYWHGDPDEVRAEPDPAKRQVVANADYELARVIQASAAAPFYFDLARIEVERGKPGIFFDGGVSPHNNPALQLAMTALVPAYGFGWKAGADRLTIISVGTGLPRPRRPRWIARRVLSVWKAMGAMLSMSYDAAQLPTSVLQWLGTSPQAWRINSEVEGLTAASPGPDLWTFLRYDAPLEAQWLAERLGMQADERALARLARLDAAAHIPELYRIGRAAGRRLIEPSHLACLDGERAPALKKAA